jgi:branched-chain amino acid transport system substrate-binding protein
MDPITSTERTGRRSWRLKTAAIAASLGLVFVAACGSDNDSGDGGTTDSTVAADELGTPNAASGEAVKVGFISDGVTASLDNSHMKPAAEATFSYINDYMAGIGGRPVELITCETAGEPGKATDCANQMVQEEVAMVVMPETQQPSAVHTVISANDIPLFVYGVTDPAITEDAGSSFMIASLTAGLSALPISVAEEKGIDNVTVFVVDVPSATTFYEPDSLGAQQFEDGCAMCHAPDGEWRGERGYRDSRGFRASAHGCRPCHRAGADRRLRADGRLRGPSIGVGAAAGAGR